MIRTLLPHHRRTIANPNLKGLVDILSMDAYKPVLDALNGTGPFTVFAPNNDAFAGTVLC
jgi:uncharacterized surface protein with fasciclin (FAS1) repeats